MRSRTLTSHLAFVPLCSKRYWPNTPASPQNTPPISAMDMPRSASLLSIFVIF